MKNLLFLLPLLLLLTSCDDDEMQPAAPLTEAEAALAADQVQLLLAGQSTLQRGYEETQVEARQEDGLSSNVSGENDPTARPKGLTCPGVEFTSDPRHLLPGCTAARLRRLRRSGRRRSGGASSRPPSTDWLISPGTEVSIDFADFSVNEYTLSGSYTESNDSLDAQVAADVQ